MRLPTMRPMRALLVLPTYQEALNLVEVLDRVRQATPDTQVLVVDDGSPDGTADLAETHGAVVGGVDVLRRPEKSGLGLGLPRRLPLGPRAGLRRPAGDGQ